MEKSMIRTPNIVINILTGLFAGAGAYTGNYWYLCGSAVCSFVSVSKIENHAEFTPRRSGVRVPHRPQNSLRKQRDLY